MLLDGRTRLAVAGGVLVLALVASGVSSPRPRTAVSLKSSVGSTAAGAAQAAGGGAAASDTSVPGQGSNGSNGSAPSAGATVPGGKAAGTSGTTHGATTGTAARRLAPGGRGVTDTTIRLGVFIADFQGLQNVKGFQVGDTKAQAQAVADQINANGGIAGRKVELHFAGMPATSNNWEADEQAVCSSLADDAKVFAVVYTLISEGRTIQPCLSSKQVPLIAPSGGPADDQVLQANHTTLYYSGGLSMTRAGKTYADGLAAQGFLHATDKIGLVRSSDESFTRASDQGLKPRLAAHGMKILQEASVDAQTSLGDTASQMPSIVLRFQQAGIDTVLFLDNGTIGPLFVEQAANQGYRPRYGFTSLSNPGFFVSNVPADSLTSSAGVGWLPGLDVDGQHDPGATAATRACAAIMNKIGQGGVDRAGTLTQRDLCDGMWFLQHALASATAITADGLAAAVDQVGDRYDSAITFAARFGSGHRDGAASYRPFRFDAGCRCYQYSGPAQPAS